MQAGLYHPPLAGRSGVQSLRILESAEYVLVRIPSVSAIVHLTSDSKNLFNSFARQVPTCSEQFGKLHELRKVPLLLRRQKMKSAEERNHVVQNRLEIVHLVVPDAVLALAHRPAF